MASFQLRRVIAAAARTTRTCTGTRTIVATGLRAASTSAVPNAVHVASNLASPQDVEDLVITYSGRNAAIPAVVRPIAVVKVGGEVITKEPETLVSSLKFLRDSGLQPVVVHGGGPQLNDELAKAGVKPEYIGGHRVTDAATMAVAKRVFEAANADLAAALKKGGLEPGQLLGGIFKAEVSDPKLGLVGEIKSVVKAPVDDILGAGKVPVLTSLGISGTGQVLNINADVAARELAIALKPVRVVFISAGGGWKEDGVVVDEVNMAADYERLVNRDYTGRQGTLLKLKEMKAIVDNLPPSSSVTIASASALAAQALPHRGPGTQIRKGQRLLSFDSLGSIDRVRLASLLEAAGVPASTVSQVSVASGPAPNLSKDIIQVLVTEDYSAAAIVTHPAGSPLPLLHTLALSPLAYNEGSEPALWRELSRSYPKGLAWLATPSLPIGKATAALQAGGAARIPSLFPPLSIRRSAMHATGMVSLAAAKPESTAAASAAGSFGATAAAAFGTVGPFAMWMGSGISADQAPAVAAAVRTHLQGAATTGDSAAAGATPKPVAVPSSPSQSGSRPVRVGLLGARGYVGRELVRLLGRHPSMQVVCASSRALVGQDVLAALGVNDAPGAVLPGLKMSDVGPTQLRAGTAPEVDVWVLALPNGLAAEHDAAIESLVSTGKVKRPVLIDLSADMRFDSSGSWAYGLPERPGARDQLRKATKISNPGCYATGSQAAIMPLLPIYNNGGAAGSISWDLTAKPHIFGVSGYSGAGTNPSDKNDPNKLRDNLLAYSLTGHIHEREIGHHCGTTVAFMPHVAPYFQGISLTVTGHIKAPGAHVTAASIAQRYADFYAGEKLMKVLTGDKEMPDVRSHGTLQHGVTVGGFTYDKASGRLAMVSCIDNLLKGAATQAVQNLNLALGLGEYDGIIA